VAAFGIIPMAMLGARFDRKWWLRKVLLIVLAVASIGVCICISILWVRSYYTADPIYFAHDDATWRAVFSRGVLTIDNSEACDLKSSLNLMAYAKLGAQRDRAEEKSVQIANELDRNPPPQRRLALEDEDRRVDAEINAITKKIFWPRTPDPETYSIHLATPAGVSAVLPMVIFGAIGIRRRRRRALARASRCPSCGYDLRATPGRCPECGRAPGKYPAGAPGS
jgi:hypothetical protein